MLHQEDGEGFLPNLALCANVQLGFHQTRGPFLSPALWTVFGMAVLWTPSPIRAVDRSSSFRVTFGLWLLHSDLLNRSLTSAQRQDYSLKYCIIFQHFSKHNIFLHWSQPGNKWIYNRYEFRKTQIINQTVLSDQNLLIIALYKNIQCFIKLEAYLQKKCADVGLGCRKMTVIILNVLWIGNAIAIGSDRPQGGSKSLHLVRRRLL